MTQPTLAKFTLVTSDGDLIPLLGGAELEVIDDVGDGHAIGECDQAVLAKASFEAFPAALTLRVHSTDGFGTFLFHEVEIYRDDSGELIAEHICHEPNKYWEGTWGLATFLGAIRDQLPFFPDIILGEIELEDDWKRLTLQMRLADGPAAQALHSSADILKRLFARQRLRWVGSDGRQSMRRTSAPFAKRSSLHCYGECGFYRCVTRKARANMARTLLSLN